MSVTQITGGLVSVEDGVKSAVEYQPPRKVRVDLHFSVAEGDDAAAGDTLQLAGTLAARQVDRLLGRGTNEAATAPLAQASAEQPAAETQRRKRRTAAEIAADEAAAAAAAAGNSPTISSGSQGSGAEGNGGAPPNGGGGEPQTSGAPAAQDTPPASGDEWASDTATADVSDAELNAACSTTAERLGDPSKVRDTIQSFNTKPAGEKFKVTEIPQAQRATFLAKLAALTK